MVAVVMGHDERVQAVDALAAEVRKDDAAAAVRKSVERRAGIVEQRVFFRAREHGKPLAHVEHGDPELEGGETPKSGSTSGTPSQRAGNPRGSSIQAIPASASGTVHARGAC